MFMKWKTQYDQDLNSPKIDLFYRFNAIKIKISAGFFEMDKLIFKNFL